jgi:hypothetical protein
VILSATGLAPIQWPDYTRLYEGVNAIIPKKCAPPSLKSDMREDKCRIRDNPGIMARARSFALNILRKNRVTNVAKALWDGALSRDHILAYKKI